MDGVIAASYIAIFAYLFWMAGKLRNSPQLQSYLWILVCFGTFILACAGTHVMEIVTLWWPVYRVSVLVKIACAVASAATAILLSRAAPASVGRVQQFLVTLAFDRMETAAELKASRRELEAQTVMIRKLNEELEQRITERTAQLEAANRELEAFTYSVSHDLRAPLRHVSGFARILRSDFACSMNTEAKELLERIEEAILRMGKLIDGLLSLARLGRQSLHVRQTEINTIVHQVISLLQPECEGREVEWRIAELPALACDAVLIGQVFQNLLGNALKYSRGRAHTVIEIDSIQRPGEPVAIFVRDNGVGFNMKYAERLFGVFQRMHTEAQFEGTGVGLATVHRIIQKHGGSVWAEAEVECGATFFFTVGGGDAPAIAQKVATAG
jgi:light-regulated signal transduction histidine kinase (bacteriophytochrome)